MNHLKIILMQLILFLDKFEMKYVPASNTIQGLWLIISVVLVYRQVD